MLRKSPWNAGLIIFQISIDCIRNMWAKHPRMKRVKIVKNQNQISHRPIINSRVRIKTAMLYPDTAFFYGKQKLTKGDLGK